VANIDVEVTMPDPVYRMVDDWYFNFGQNGRMTRDQTVEAFQEIINLIGRLLPFEPDMDDIMYYRQMDENVAVFEAERKVSPEAEKIGKAFLLILRERVNAPVFEFLLNEESRRGDDPAACDPGGGMKDWFRDRDDDEA
jgi:hypothetical protein